MKGEDCGQRLAALQEQHQGIIEKLDNKIVKEKKNTRRTKEVVNWKIIQASKDGMSLMSRLESW